MNVDMFQGKQGKFCSLSTVVPTNSAPILTTIQEITPSEQRRCSSIFSVLFRESPSPRLLPGLLAGQFIPAQRRKLDEEQNHCDI